MRFFLITIGSHGDIHPFLAVGSALRKRGHEVALAVNPYFERQATDAGVHYVPLGERIDLKEVISDSRIMHPVWGPLTVLREFTIPVLPTIAETTDAALRDFKPDAALIHPLCFASSWVCEKAGVPRIHAALAPSNWFSPGDQLVMSAWMRHDPGPFRCRVQAAIGRFMMRLALDGPINKFRKTLGLPKSRNILMNELRAGCRNLGLWSPHFRAPIDSDPPGSKVVGFPWHDRHVDAEDDLIEIDRFLDEGEPPIIFTLGTAAVHSAGPFYSIANDVCRRLKRRAMLLVGRPEYAPKDLAPGVRAFTYAPYSRVFPRAAVNVHQCGIGTTAQGLRAGRPVLATPMAHDQFDNAARLKRLGVAEIVQHPRLTPDRLETALRTVLESPTATPRAAELGREISKEDGGLAAAIELESLAKSPRTALW